jgi:hypothetical protein
MKNGIENYDDHPLLSEDGFWAFKNAVKVETLSMAIAALDHSMDLATAKDTLTKIRDSYALASWPGVKDESTDHLL